MQKMKWSLKGPVNAWRVGFGSLNTSSYCHYRCQKTVQKFTWNWQVCLKTHERFSLVGTVLGGLPGGVSCCPVCAGRLWLLWPVFLLAGSPPGTYLPCLCSTLALIQWSCGTLDMAFVETP